MLDGAPSIDSVFLPLKEIAMRGNSPLRVPMRSFLGKLNELLTSRKNLPEQAANLRDEQFSLRIKAITWLMKNEEIDLAEKIKQLETALKEREGDPELGVLITNMRFALHAQLETMEAMTKVGLDFSEMDAAPYEQLQDIEFSQFESVLMVGVPNQQAAHVLLGWMHASMDMEVGLLMGDSVVTAEVNITPTRLEHLNGFLVSASQNYAASARVLGIVSNAPEPIALAAEPLSASWVKGQKRLADQGLGDWLSL